MPLRALTIQLAASLFLVAAAPSVPAQQAVRPYRVAIVANTVPLAEWSSPT